MMRRLLFIPLLLFSTLCFAGSEDFMADLQNAVAEAASESIVVLVALVFGGLVLVVLLIKLLVSMVRGIFASARRGPKKSPQPAPRIVRAPPPPKPAEIPVRTAPPPPPPAPKTTVEKPRAMPPPVTPQADEPQPSPSRPAPEKKPEIRTPPPPKPVPNPLASGAPPTLQERPLAVPAPPANDLQAKTGSPPPPPKAPEVEPYVKVLAEEPEQQSPVPQAVVVPKEEKPVVWYVGRVQGNMLFDLSASAHGSFLVLSIDPALPHQASFSFTEDLAMRQQLEQYRYDLTSACEMPAKPLPADLRTITTSTPGRARKLGEYWQVDAKLKLDW